MIAVTDRGDDPKSSETATATSGEGTTSMSHEWPGFVQLETPLESMSALLGREREREQIEFQRAAVEERQRSVRRVLGQRREDD